MAHYTFKVSRCDWDCLSKALRDRCDVGNRGIPWCQPASLLCTDTGGCNIQCDDSDKPNMPPIQNVGLKTFLHKKRVLCRKGEAYEITTRCEECDIEVKTIRVKLPKRRKRLPCDDIQEMLDQDQIQFDCIYKVCDCQEEYDNWLISNCKVTNIGKGQDETDQSTDSYRNSEDKKTTDKKEKEKSNTSSPPNDTRGQKEVPETTTSTNSTTYQERAKGKGTKSRENDEKTEPVDRESTTSATTKKDSKKKKGKNTNENTTSISPTSRGKKKGKGRKNAENVEDTEPVHDESSPNKRKGSKNGKGKGTLESTTTSVSPTSSKPRKKGYNQQCYEYETENERTTDLTRENMVNVTSEATSGVDADESTTDPVVDVRSNTTKELESTFSVFPTIVSTEIQRHSGSTTTGTVSDIYDTTKGEERTTTSSDVKDKGSQNETTNHVVTYASHSGEGQAGYVSTGGYENMTKNINGTTATERIAMSSEANSAVVTQQPDTVTLQRSGLPFHETSVFNYALAGGVAGIVILLLVMLCIVLFTKDRKRKKKQRIFLDSMNLPPPPHTPDEKSRAVFSRKSSMRLSTTLSLKDQRHSSARMKSFSLKKIDPPDTNNA